MTITLCPNPRRPLKLVQASFDEKGRPLCPGMHPMINWGFEAKRGRTKWRCPRLAGRKCIRDSIQCNQQYGKPDYGKTRYTYRDKDKRAFPSIPRGTERWKTLYRQRSASERINKRYNDYKLDIHRSRGCCAWYHRATYAAVNMHLDAWI